MFLQIATETSLSEKAKLEQRGEDLEGALTQTENERGELIIRVNSLKEDVRSLEEQIKDMANRLTDTQDENSQNKSKATQMKYANYLLFCKKKKIQNMKKMFEK